jgi:hypothetical protein
MWPRPARRRWPGGRGYAVDTQRTVAVRQLADKCEHRLFLSATPHNGYPESFTALMEMIDPRRFSRGAMLDSRALKDVAVRRLKRDLTGKGFKNRQVKTLPFTPDDTSRRCSPCSMTSSPRSCQTQRHQAGWRHRDDVAQEAVSLQPVRLRTRHSPTTSSSKVQRGLSDDDYDDIFGEGQSDEEEGLWEQDEV